MKVLLTLNETSQLRISQFENEPRTIRVKDYIGVFQKYI